MFGSPRILFSCLPEFLPRKGRSYPALGCPVRSRGPESIPLTPPHGRRRKPKYTRPMDADFAKRCIAMQRQKVKILIAINQFHRGDYYALARPLLVPPATADLFVRRAYSDRCRLLVRKQLQASHESQRFFAPREIWDYAAVKCQCKA